MSNRQRRKRVLSGLTALALAVSGVMPNGLQTIAPVLVSAESVPNLTDTLHQDDVTLLVGRNSPLAAETVEETIANADETYLLGIASQFSVFMENCFVPHESDAEGRMAVGGSIISATPWGSYEVGKGHYISADAGVNLEYLLQNSGFATVIWGGNSSPRYPDPQCSGLEMTKGYSLSGGFANVTKLLVAQSDAAAQYINNQQAGLRNVTYQADLIDFQKQFEQLRKRSAILANKPTEFSSSYDPDNFGTLTLTWNGAADAVQDVVYCTLTTEELEQFQNAATIKFENIPKTSNPIETSIAHESGGGKTDLTWDYAYIIVNILDEGEPYDSTNPDRTEEKGGLWLGNPEVGAAGTGFDYGYKYTFINGKSISKDRADLDNPDGERYKNNHPGVESLIYNIPNAQQVVVAGSIQGTILAPNAHNFEQENGAGWIV